MVIRGFRGLLRKREKERERGRERDMSLPVFLVDRGIFMIATNHPYFPRIQNLYLYTYIYRVIRAIRATRVTFREKKRENMVICISGYQVYHMKVII